MGKSWRPFKTCGSTQIIHVVWGALQIHGRLWLRGRASVLLSEGCWFDPACRSVLGARYWTQNRTLHGSHRHQCMNVCMNYCESHWTRAPAKYLKCKSSLSLTDLCSPTNITHVWYLIWTITLVLFKLDHNNHWEKQLMILQSGGKHSSPWS